MRGHEEIERILASYRDAGGEERARADAHVAGCPACAARLAAFQQVDTALAGLPPASLPARLNRPLAVVMARAEGGVVSSTAGLAFGSRLAPAAVVIVALLALSALFFSLSWDRTPATLTPTMTRTLTPTLVAAHGTVPAAITSSTSVPLAGAAPAVRAGPAPTPAPAPAPHAGTARILLAGYGAHATMIH